MSAQLLSIFGPGAGLVSHVLVHSLWQGGFIALTLGIVLLLFPRAKARLRYALSCSAMAAIIALSVITGMAIWTGESPANMTATAIEQSRPYFGPVYDGNSETIGAVSGVSPQDGAFGTIPLADLVFPVWLFGVLALSVYHLAGWHHTRRLIRHGIAEIPMEWVVRFKRLCHDLKVNRAVRMAGSSRIGVPCVVGWLKPVVLVPLGSLTGLATEELELILLHELAHIRRWDVLAGYLQTAAEIVFFFNPAVWWISRQISVERENCCDDIAVERCGDRVRFARALANLEELRTVPAGYAAAADGSPLTHRIRRLFGLTVPRGQSVNMGVAGIFLITSLLVFSLGSITSSLSTEAKAETQIESTGTFEPERSDIEGEWEIELQGRYAQIIMSFGRHQRCGFSISTDELFDAINENTTYFRMVRDAGTFHFQGNFTRNGDELWGDGDCYFRADPDYVEEMERMGFDLDDEEDVLTLAIHDVTLAFTRGLYDLGYDDLSFEELLKAHIHDVTPEFIRELDDLGYRNLDLDELVKMQIHDAEPGFIRELAKLGYEGLSIDELVKMKIHDAEPEFIRDLADLGYTGLSVDELVKMRIHDAGPDVIHDLAELGYDDLSVDELVEMQIHDVSPAFIEDLAELGYRNLSESALVTMRIHDVSPSFIRKLARLGYDGLSTQRLVEMKIHDVTPGYIRELAELGYEGLSPSMLVKMQIHDVTPSFIRKLQKRGIDDLSAEELVRYKIARM